MAALAAVRSVRSVSRVYVIASRKTMEKQSVAGMNGLCNILTGSPMLGVITVSLWLSV